MNGKADSRRLALVWLASGCILAMARPGWAEKGSGSGLSSRGATPAPGTASSEEPGDDFKPGQADGAGDDAGDSVGSGSGRGTSPGRKKPDGVPRPGDPGETAEPPPGGEKPSEAPPIPEVPPVPKAGETLTHVDKSIMDKVPREWLAPRPPEDIPPDAGALPDKAAGRSGIPGAVPAQATAGMPDPANPVSAEEFALASMTGYRQTFDALGLKVGRGPGGKALVTHPDGTPASETELGRLAQRIKQEPAALVGRPDFFDILPRERFMDLKEDFHDSEGSGEEFKHISLSPGERDFKRSASCARASGSCNRFARRSYKRGEFVPPEDLWDVSEALDSGRTAKRGGKGLRPGGFGQDDDGEASSLQSAISQSKVGGVSAKLASIFKSIGSLWEGGGGDEDAGGRAAGRSPGPDAGAGAVRAGGFGPERGGGSASPAGANIPGAAGRARRAWDRPVPAPKSKAPRSGLRWWPLAAAVMVGILFAWRRRSRSDAEKEGS